MTTCEPLPGGGEDDEPLTLFAADSPVSPSVKRARSSRRRIAGGSGLRSRMSFARYDPDTCSWRTFQGSFDVEWETYSETWPASGMTRNGIAYQRPSSVPPIYETESGSWLTPTVEDAGREGSLEVAERWAAGETIPTPDQRLRTQVLARSIWPTPKGSAANYGRPRENDRGDLQAAVLTFPTPTANRWDGLQSHGVNVVSGQLNPTWVEWLMGYPPGWTDCGDSGTP